MKRRIFTSLAAAGAVAASILITSGGRRRPPDATATSTQSAAGTTTTDPAKLVAVDPTQFRIIATLPGVGKQVYDCNTTTGKYGLREPMAGLFTSRGVPAGIHGGTAGTTTSPFWANFDGSRVTGNTAAGADGFVAADARNPTRDVKWLRVPAASNAGVTGAFSKVKFIQRINTKGGQPPGSCTTPLTVSVDYATDYAFWVPIGT